MAFSLLSILCCIWDVISEPVNRCLGRAADDSLSFLWERAVASVRDYTRFWGNQVQQVPVSTASDLAGLDEIRRYEQEIAAGLCDDRVGVIGIHGMGGVGKTTLLKRINNNFRHLPGAPRFDVVIWVTVSQKVDLLKIQKSIAERIGLTLPSVDLEERARQIFDDLRKRRFLLLLDDLWERIKWDDIGIPPPENKSKVILTTRSTEVCHRMGANKLLELKVLNPSEAWKLFKEKVGAEVDLDAPLIEPYAKAVVQKCGGLPLALIAVGCAMADVKDGGEWEDALRQFSRVSGMTEEVLSPLKFSYDRLANETLRQCLLYCCLYPEDTSIAIEDILYKWVGEGFAKGRNEGRGFITSLVKASLLHYATENEDFVKMHDMLRELCLWITGDVNNAFLVLEESSHSYERWENKMRISLMCKKQHWVLPDSSPPSCLHLRSLIFFGAREEVSVIPRDFFCSMPVLRVLDLSWTRLKSLPDDVGLLAELRYLNLDGTPIESLPRGFGKLTSLILLSLNHTRDLTDIPREAVRVITNVRVLRMVDCGHDLLSQLIASLPTMDDDRRGGERYSITPPASSSSGESLRDEYYYYWKNLEEVGLSVTSRHSLEVLLSSDSLRTCCVDVCLSTGRKSIPAERLSMALGGMENLRRLRISGSGINGALILGGKGKLGRRKLEELELFDVHGIHDIAWVRDLPCIRSISLSGCDGIKEVLPPATTTVGGDDDDSLDRSSLLSLRELRLENLPALRRISSRPMLFPSLKSLWVKNCSNLEELFLLTTTVGGDNDDSRDRSSLLSLRRLWLVNLPALRRISSRPMLFSSLESLWVIGCSNLEELLLMTTVGGDDDDSVDGSSLLSLRELKLENLPVLRRISSRPMLFPSLEALWVTECSNLEELLLTTTVGGDDDDSLDRSSLLSLTLLWLENLPALRRISSRPMLFPSLERLWVTGCSKLEELPLTASSAPNMRDIRCSRRLWESLGTADGGSISLRSRLLPFYREC